MKDLICAALILATGFGAGLLILRCASHAHKDFNWSQQALRDPAADGCPGQYHEYSQQFLISCWGHKENTDDGVPVDMGRLQR
jgi:hypothetical protein